MLRNELRARLAAFGLFLGLGLGLATPAARAGGFATARFGGEYGHPTTDNPTAIYFNPAGLALGDGNRLFVEGSFAYRSASYERPVEAIDNVVDAEGGGVGTPSDAISANSGTATLGNLIASPFVGASGNFGIPNLGLGLAFYVPFGGQSSWDRNDRFADSEEYPGAVDGVQRWSTIEGSLRDIYMSLGGAYRFPSARLSVGASLNLIRESVNTLRARVPAGTDDLVTPTGTLEGRSLVDTNGFTVSAGVGVIWQPVEELYLGVSYQSQPGFGETSQDGTLTNRFGSAGPMTSEIELLQSLPDVFRIGARYLVRPDIELRFSADYTRWSVFERQCLIDKNDPAANCALDEDGGLTDDTVGVVVNAERDWKDTFGGRLGGSYWTGSGWELAGSVSYDSSAVPAGTLDAALMDMNKVLGTAGIRKHFAGVLWNLSYTHVYYFTRTVPARTRDAMGEPDAPPTPSRVPDGAGRYEQQIGLVNLGAQVEF